METRVYLGRHVLQWHITHRCNLRCTHCYQEDYTRLTPREELFEALDWYERFLEKRSLRAQINLTGGEPLSHPAFFELAREIARRGHRFSVLTNGTLISRRCAERLAALSPRFVQVSLDGARRAHDAIRGEGSFARALAGIDALKSEGVPVLVSFTAQSGNLGELEKLARICKRHRVDKLWFDRVVIPKAEDTGGLTLSTEAFRRLLKTAERLEKRTPVSRDRALQFLCGGGDCYRCSAGEDLLILLADGGLMPCRRLPFVIGNRRDGELHDILENSTLMRQLKNAPVPGACSDCPHAENCHGGAKCLSQAVLGDWRERDPDCWMAVDKSGSAALQ